MVNIQKSLLWEKLKPNAIQVIKEFAQNMNILHENFSLSYTNKIHIIIDHVPEYLRENKLSLGQTSDQLIEASHQFVNKRFTNSKYTINNVDYPSHDKKLLKGLNHINSYNSLTR